MSTPKRPMSRRNPPSAPIRSGIASAPSAALASTRAKCSPTRNDGLRRAISTASRAAGAATIRLAEVRTPPSCALSTASLTSLASPKSSAVTTSRFRSAPSLRRGAALAQEAEKFSALAQPPPHHFRASDHLVDDRGDLARAEIEAAIEGLDRLENFCVAEAGIVQRRDLHAVFVDEGSIGFVEPAVLHRLIVKESAGVGRGERNLDRVRIDLGGEADRLLDRLSGFSRQAHDERAVDPDAEFAAILGETPGDVDPHALLHVVQDLLIAGLVAHEQQPQAAVAQDLERLARHVGLGVAGPDDAELAHFLGDRFGARQIVGERVVVEEEFLHFRKGLLRPCHLFHHMPDRAGAIAMSAHRLRPEAKGAARLASAPRVQREIGMLQIAVEIAADLEVAAVDGSRERQEIHVLDDRTIRGVLDFAGRVAEGQAWN